MALRQSFDESGEPSHNASALTTTAAFDDTATGRQRGSAS
jgi:hypothetical protein